MIHRVNSIPDFFFGFRFLRPTIDGISMAICEDSSVNDEKSSVTTSEDSTLIAEARRN
jgi:hypothetical protein